MSDKDRSSRNVSGSDAAPGVPVDPEAPTRIAGEFAEDSDSLEKAKTRLAEPTGSDPAVPTVVDEPAASEGTDTGPTELGPEPDPLSSAETVVRPRAAAADASSAPRADAATALGTGPSPDSVDVNAVTRVSGTPNEERSAPEPRSSGIAPGSILFGEYEIVEVLGAGGMGEVYRARHRRLGEFRAIKMMHAELAKKQGANEFFLREAKALLAVRHPAVVHCHDLLSDEAGRVYLIMEMIEGPSLGDRLAEGPLPADQVVLLGARLAAGLQAAHACGVVHRDVSPDNVVLPDGEVEQAKLIDFGIAKILQEGQGTIVDGFKGKLGYASPEQLGFFGGHIDGRSDFYSLGLVLCAAALGRPMGMGTTVVEAVDARRGFQHVPDEIPVGLRSAIEPLLALDPRDRPKSVEGLFLSSGGGQLGLEAIRARESLLPGRGERKGFGWMRVAAAGLALALGVAGYWVFGSGVGEEGEPVQTVGAEIPIAKVVAPKGAEVVAEPENESPQQNPPSATRRRSALDEIRIVGLLRGAEAALSENRLQSPKGDNAYEKYRAVLEIDPHNQDARRGLVSVAGHYLRLSERALAKSDTEQARSYLARASAIAPHHPELDAVRAQVEGSAPP